jgi:hypothetical protein
VPVNTATFSFHEYSAIAISRVFAGLARLPSRTEMREAYLKRSKVTGEARRMHILGAPGEVTVVAELVAWLNDEAEQINKAKGGTAKVKEVRGHDQRWLEVTRNRLEGFKARDGIPSKLVFDKDMRLIREASNLL